MEQTRSIDTLIDLPIPIEAGIVSGWKEIPIVETEEAEPLVPLGSFSDHSTISTSSVYSGEHSNSPYPDGKLKGNLLTLFARESVAKRLEDAQAMLPTNMRLVVFDSYRTLDIQQSLYDQYYNALAAQNPGWSAEQLSTETQKYVSLPSSPELNPSAKFVSPHNTGGAIDLAIFELPNDVANRIKDIESNIKELDSGNENGETENWKEIYQLEMEKIALINTGAKMLDFGTDFDHGGEKAALSYFEQLAKGRPLTAEEQLAQRNRRLLYNTMTRVGFQPYADEWWHFNAPETQMGAKVAGKDHAAFGSAHLSEKNKQHEEMRKSHRSGTILIAGGLKIPDINNSEFLKTAIKGAAETGDLRPTSLPNVEAIKPAA